MVSRQIKLIIFILNLFKETDVDLEQIIKEFQLILDRDEKTPEENMKFKPTYFVHGSNFLTSAKDIVVAGALHNAGF